MKTSRIFHCLWAAALVSLFWLQPARAQTELKDVDRATIAFDLRLDKLMADLKEAGVNTEDLEAMPLQRPFRDFKLGDVVRIYGGVSMPKDLGEFMQFTPEANDPPFNAYVRIRFKSSLKAEEALAGLNTRGDNEVEIDGVKYMVENTNRPRFAMAHLSDMSELEIGTGKFILHPNRDLMTEGLAARWKKVPNHAFRLAVDLESNAEVVAQLIKFVEAEAPPMAAPFVGLLDNAKGLILSADAESDTLLQLTIDGNDQDDAVELQEGLDGIFGILKFGAAAEITRMQSQMPDVAKVAKSIIDSLKATVKGDQVIVSVPRPEGMFAAVEKMMQFVQQQAKEVQRMNNLRQLALAAMNYESAYQKFPFLHRNLNLSWRVKVLPFLEELALYEQIAEDEAADSETNKPFADKMPVIFGKDGKNSNVVWVKSDVTGFGNITDGSSNTIMLMEFPQGTPWMENGDISQEDALKLLSSLKDGEVIAAAFYDGSVHRITNKVPKDTLRKLLNPVDGEVVDFDF